MSAPPTMQMRQVLAQLELISHGSTQAWDSDGRGGGERLLPPGELYPPHIHYRQMWDRATSDERRQSVYSEAVIALQDITLRDPAKRRESLDEREIMKRRILDEGRGWSVADVARTLRTTSTWIRRVRLDAGMDTESGLPLAILKSTPKATSRAAWAHELSAKGMTQQQIADRMGISQPTVNRLLLARRFDAAA